MMQQAQKVTLNASIITDKIANQIRHILRIFTGNFRICG